MHVNRQGFRRILRWGVSAVMVLAAAYIVLVLAGIAPNRLSCNSQREIELTNISGHDFEITYTNCDGLAKEEFVSVYISSGKSSGKWWLPGWMSKKGLLFRYDPAMPNAPLPSIKASGQDKVVISIPRVSSIIFEIRKWKNLSVDYEIGRIDYPPTNQSGSPQ